MHSLSSNTPQHKTSSVSSDTDAHRAPGHFLRKDGPADILRGRDIAELGEKVLMQKHEFMTQIQYLLIIRSLSFKTIEPHFPHPYKWIE